MRVLVFCSLIFVSVSCDFARVYEQNTPVSDGIWVENAPQTFEVAITDKTKHYNLYFNLRNTNEYKYSNLYVISELKLPSKQVEKDTLQFILCDANGKWLGTNSGALVTHQILFQRNVLFPDTGTYRFTFNQAMRDASLQGITEVGLRVEKAE